MTRRTATPLIVALLAAAPAQAQTLGTHETNLAEGAKTALRAQGFDARNRLHVESVTAETAALAARSVGARGRERALLTQVFRSAVRQAGEAYRPVFENGDRAARLAAPAAAKTAAHAHLPAALAAMDGRAIPDRRDLDRATRLLDRVRLDDVQRLVARGTTLNGQPLPSVATLQFDLLRIAPAGDPLLREVARVPDRTPGAPPLNTAELKALDLAVRLADATWKSGQVHEALLRRDLSRVDPFRSSYQPFDLKLMELNARTYNGAEPELREERRGQAQRPLNDAERESVRARAGELAHGRVVFEVFRNLHDLKQAQAAAAPADFIGTRRRLRAAYADALKRMTLPQLLTEARAAGVDLRKRRTLLNHAAIVRVLAETTGHAPTNERTKLTETKANRGARGLLQGLIPGRSSKRRVRGR